ncbi:MAG: DedA family protein, partial [Dehalococcoidia bacterium]
MTLLGHLHGTVAAVLICALLFIDETGVPVPIAPNEVLLILGGVLAQTGAFPIELFYTAAFVSMLAGMLTGYGWARAVGRPGLDRLIRLFGAQGVYQKLVARLEAAGPAGIGFVRLLPGARPWATLVSGAIGLPPRRFLLGAVPALIAWQGGWTLLGVLVGVPAEHFLGRFERLALR